MEKWEKEFDRIFVDENVWQGEDDYTKNVPIGNIKKFIESLLEERDTYWKERVDRVLIAMSWREENETSEAIRVLAEIRERLVVTNEDNLK